jgi:hypothetical protein
MKNYRKTIGDLKSLYAITAIFLFSIFIYIVEYSTFKKKSSGTTDYCLIELQPEVVSEIISARPRFVLFYDENTDICEKMGYNPDQATEKKKNSKLTFFRLNTEKHPEYITACDNMPSVTLIFKKNKEIKRITGNAVGKNPEIMCNKRTK